MTRFSERCPCASCRVLRDLMPGGCASPVQIEQLVRLFEETSIRSHSKYNGMVAVIADLYRRANPSAAVTGLRGKYPRTAAHRALVPGKKKRWPTGDPETA
jgi:hypothetical protein